MVDTGKIDKAQTKNQKLTDLVNYQEGSLHALKSYQIVLRAKYYMKIKRKHQAGGFNENRHCD